MGLCSSQPAVEEAGPRHQVPALGLANAARQPPVTLPGSGLQLDVTSTRWAAHGEGNASPMVVKQTPHHIFLSLFDGLGADPAALATLCSDSAYQTFLSCAELHPGDLPAALKETFRRLDALVLDSRHLPPAKKAASGAAGVLVVVDLRDQQAYVSNVGNAHVLLGRIVGSFNSKEAVGTFLSKDHTLREAGEKVRMERRRCAQEAAGAARPAAAGAAEARAQAGTELTRAIGFGGIKQGRADGGYLTCEADVTVTKLSPGDQHLILGSSGFWDVVGPSDAALRAHLYERFLSKQLMRSYASALALGTEAPTPSLQQTCPTPAAELALYCVATLAQRLERHMDAEQSLSVADMKTIPFVRAPGSSPAAAEGLQQFIRSELHGDLAVAVVSLRWQNGSMDASLQELVAAAKRSGVEEPYVRRLARQRWDRIRMLAEFQKIRRRTILRQWWKAAEAVYRTGRIRAKKVQERVLYQEGLAVQVSPSLKVTPLSARLHTSAT